MSEPFLKVPRLLLKLKDPKNPFSKRPELLTPFLVLVNEANWVPGKEDVRQIGRPLYIGELVMTRRDMMALLDMAERECRCFLDWLEDKRLIYRVPGGQKASTRVPEKVPEKVPRKVPSSSVIYICNYEEKYAGQQAKVPRKVPRKVPEKVPVKRSREEENKETTAKAVRAELSLAKLSSEDSSAPEPTAPQPDPTPEEEAIGQKMAEVWNKYMPVKSGAMNNELVRRCNARYHEGLARLETMGHGPEQVWNYFSSLFGDPERGMGSTPFLLGGGKRGFVASFYWAMMPGKIDRFLAEVYQA